jgi:hypothetical protein
VKDASSVSNRIKSIIEQCNLANISISAVVTDGGEIATASKIGTDDTLWIWCCVHLLSLAFEGSFCSFPQNSSENKPHFLVQLRKIINTCITNFDKLQKYLNIPGCSTVSFLLFINILEEKIQETL